MAAWVARESFGSLRGIGFLNWGFDVFLILAKPTAVDRPRQTLCAFPALRALFFFFILAKPSAAGRAQRNCRPLKKESPSRNSAGQAYPLVRACPDANREGVAEPALQKFIEVTLKSGKGQPSAAADSLRLPYFAACPAELRGAKYFFSFFFSPRRRAAKKLWSARFDFPPRRTGTTSCYLILDT